MEGRRCTGPGSPSPTCSRPLRPATPRPGSGWATSPPGPFEYALDPNTRLRPGDQGTVAHITDCPQPAITVHWNDGSTLAILPDVGDQLRLLSAAADPPSRPPATSPPASAAPSPAPLSGGACAAVGRGWQRVRDPGANRAALLQAGVPQQQIDAFFEERRASSAAAPAAGPEGSGSTRNLWALLYPASGSSDRTRFRTKGQASMPSCRPTSATEVPLACNSPISPLDKPRARRPAPIGHTLAGEYGFDAGEPIAQPVDDRFNSLPDPAA
jgi:Domain of unknown function (DUF4314)